MHIYILCSKYLHYFHEIKHYNTPRTCCVGYNERKREQAHIPHAPLLLDNDTSNEWQGMHLIHKIIQ